MRDGYIEVNGLKADFRLIRPHHASNTEASLVDTAVGEHWIKDTDLHWDNVTQAKPQVKFECHEKPCP